MKYYWKKHKSEQLLTSLLNLAFLWQLTLLPLMNSDNITATEHNYLITYRQYEEAYIIQSFTGNELLNYIELKHILGRNLKDIQRLSFRNLEDLLFPMMRLGIILLYTLTYFKRLKQQVPILATSLGGHAPPVIVLE